MDSIAWHSRCITLKADGVPYGYIAFSGTNPEQTAIGGIRILPETFDPNGINLAIALAETMRLKSQSTALPLQGAKSVLYIPPGSDHAKILQHFASELNKLNGRYIAAVDLGCKEADMNLLKQHTPHITCCTETGGDPSPYTAMTVIESLQAALPLTFSNPSLNTKTIIIQGAGKVGTEIAKQLRQLSSSLTLAATDISADALIQIRQYNVTPIPAEKIYDYDCDIFIAAASSFLIGIPEADKLNCKLFISAANNPFKNQQASRLLQKKGITVIPDYVANGGGLIHCAYQHKLINMSDLEEKISNVCSTTHHFLKADSSLDF